MKRFPAAHILFTSILAASTTVLAQKSAVRDNAPNCDCFVASGKEAAYFQNHRFIDFRNITPASGEDFTIPPALLGDLDDQGAEQITSSYFDSDTFNNDWFISNGSTSHTGPVRSVDTAQDVFIFQDGDLNLTYLALRAQRLKAFVSNAEVNTNIIDILYSSMRTRARLVPAMSSSNAPQPYINTSDFSSIDGLNTSHPVAPGAVLGFFTFQSDTSESDIEILTSDPTSNIRYSNQPDYNAELDQTVPGASTDLTLQNGLDWTEWHDHRIDWYASMSRWYVDDVLVLEKTINVPTTPAQLILNLWSDGGNWSQNMSVGAQVVAGFQWVEMVYNVSGGNGASGQCALGCNVDGVKVRGTPEKAFGNAAAGKIKPALLYMVVYIVGFYMWFGL